MKTQRNKTFEFILKIAGFSLLFSLSVENFFYYPNYTDLVEDISVFFGGNLSMFEDPVIRENFNGLVAFLISLILFLASCFYWFVNRKQFARLCKTSTVFVLVYYVAEWSAASYQWAYPLETSLQWSIFFLLAFLTNRRLREVGLVSAISFTFIGHAVYAYGILPTPGYFVDMVSKAFTCNDASCRMILKVFALIDLILVMGIWIRPMYKLALSYMVFWGLITALARPVLNFSPIFWEQSLLIWIPEMLQRLVHGLAPLALLIGKVELPLVKIGHRSG